MPNGGCNLPAASTFPLAADCSPAELNGDLWFFLFLITGQPACQISPRPKPVSFLAQFLLAPRARPSPGSLGALRCLLFIYIFPSKSKGLPGHCCCAHDETLRGQQRLWVLRPWGPGSSHPVEGGGRGGRRQASSHSSQLAGDCRKLTDHSQGQAIRPSFLLRAGSGTGSTCQGPKWPGQKESKPGVAGSLSQLG